MLEDTNIDAISWSKDETAVVLYDINRLCSDVLPLYFNHGKFKSFQRQLNYFGFRKWTKNQTDVCTFSHPAFVRYDMRMKFCTSRRHECNTIAHVQTTERKDVSSTISTFMIPSPAPIASGPSVDGKYNNPQLIISAPMNGKYDDSPRLSINTKEPVRKSTVGFKRSLASEFAASVQPKKRSKYEINFVNERDMAEDRNDEHFNESIDSLAPVTGDFQTLFDKESSPFPIENNGKNWMDMLLREDSDKSETKRSSEKSYLNSPTFFTC